MDQHRGHRLSKLYFYFNLPNREDDDELPERELYALDTAGYTIDLRRVVIDHVAPSTPSTERSALTGLLRRMKKSDVLVVTKLAFLGSSVRDALSTIDRCRKAGLRVQCEEIGPANLAAVSAPIAVRTMMAIAEMEHQSASARTRAYLGRAKNEGQALGRPASLNSQQQTRILERLARGATVSEVAKQFQTSRQTVMRIRDKARTR
ncbi:recombinase family protein [Trinickia sp.]|uniref:recombinase family protein n=1 Tax=Trinickia sp. TaxID=2571163 RepID=UPI003F7F26F5